MLRENFVRRKREIQEEIQTMLQRIQTMLEAAIESMEQRDPERLEQTVKAVRQMDREVNDCEESVYHHCIQLISLEQPVASDLRFSIGVLKFIGDLERVGDHCVHLVRIVHRNDKLAVRADVPQGLFAMTAKIRQMYQLCAQAIASLDAELALEIIAADVQLDEVHKQFIKENARQMHSEPEQSDSCLNFMFLSHFIERIGDHIVNIAEWLVFIREGTRPS